MTKFICFLIFAFSLSAAAYSQPKQLKNFIQVYEALKNGEKVSAVIHYRKCKLVSDGQEYDSPDAVGGMDVLPWEHFAAGLFGKNIAFISSSETVLINIPKLGYIYNYVKLKISEDNTVGITARYLTTDKYEVKMDETFYGEINDGVNEKGVYFYSH